MGLMRPIEYGVVLFPEAYLSNSYKSMQTCPCTPTTTLLEDLCTF
jgi:hypothetical protein